MTKAQPDTVSINPRLIKFATKATGAAFWNARQTFQKEEMDQLKRTIKQDGLINPPLVRRIGNDYQIVAGEKRQRSILKLLADCELCYDIRSGKMLPAEKVYGLVSYRVEWNCDDKRASRLSVAENLDRKDVSDLDLMAYCIDLCELKKPDGTNCYTREAVEHIIGRSQTWISQTMGLFDLSDLAKTMLADGRLQRSCALALLKVNPENVDQVIKEGMALASVTSEEDIKRLENVICNLEDEKEVVECELVIASMTGDTDEEREKKAIRNNIEKKINDAQSRITNAKRRDTTRLTSDILHRATDAVPGSRKGKAACLAQKMIRSQYTDLTELIHLMESNSGDTIYKPSGEPFDLRDLKIVQMCYSVILGKREQRDFAKALADFYAEENRPGWESPDNLDDKKLAG